MEWWKITMFKRFIVGLALVSNMSSISAADEKILNKDLASKSPAVPSSTLAINLGEHLTEPEISQFAITVFPDGTNLPDGQGSVSQGKELYKSRCMMCHGEDGDEGPAARLNGSDGWFSISDPLRILRIEKYPILLISVASLWPYATTIFDYVRRAMPHYAPKSLSNDEVYALTAYILYMNNYIEKKLILDKQTILDVRMPGQKRSISDW